MGKNVRGVGERRKREDRRRRCGRKIKREEKRRMRGRGKREKMVDRGGGCR